MPDDHRGPHPADAKDLGPQAVPALREAVADLSWLLGRGYTEPAAVKVVGDRWGLTRRQRQAVARSACTDAARDDRARRRVADPAGHDVAVDAFNVLITLERALSGGPVLVGRDGAVRDIASVHGTWRAVLETPEAIVACARALAGAASVTWLVDAPVSNSGRLAALLREIGEREGVAWTAEVVPRPDPVLAVHPGVVCTSDAWILDRCAAWTDLAGRVIATVNPLAWRVVLG